VEPEGSFPCSQDPLPSVHVLSSCFSKIHFNITFPYIIILPSGLFPSVSYQNSVCISVHPCTCHRLRPPHYFRFDNSKNLMRAKNHGIMQLSSILLLLSLRPKFLHRHCIPEHRQPLFFLYCEELCYTHYAAAERNIMNSRREDKTFWTEW
jgi:hypothetical protein